MVNAYEILQNNSANTKIREIGIHEYTKFKGLITIDSGGFLFMSKKTIDITPKIILELYEKSKPNFGVILDHPLNPSLPNEINKKRLSKTLQNTKKMLQSKQSSNPELMPVIHGYDTKTIKDYVKKLNKIGDFNIYGIGSLVPSVFNTKGASGIYNAVKIVSYIRKLLPTKTIHVFGIGSTVTMHIMFYAGADSIDSSSWRSKAAFGAIQLPGLGDRYITPRKRHKTYPQLKNDELKLLEECKCPICKKNGVEGLKRSFTLRALHNAWIYQREIEKTRKLMRNGDYEDYVKQVISKTRFSKTLAFLDKHT
jgi:tRNA-guanine family transglycosylase